MKEYRKIKSLNFLYEISSDGEVRNVKSKKILKYETDKDGYYRLTFNNKSLSKQNIHRFVHQLVMECWGPEKPGPEYQIDHIDRNRKNPDITNLRWVTVKENAQNRDNSIYKDKFTDEDREKSSMVVSKPITNGEMNFKNSYEAAVYIKNKLNLTSNLTTMSNHIRNCANGNRKIAYGFKWTFIIKPVETTS